MVSEAAAGSGTIAENLARVRGRIERAAARAGRAPSSVRLVGVSKTFPPQAIVQALRAGLSDVGENYIQEAATKVAEVAATATPRPRWHLVGHLQTNKVRTALELFDVIESVDSVRLAEALSRRAVKPVEVLLEVNVAGEATKTGFSPEEVPAAAGRIAALPNLALRGLMTVAPEADDPEEVRPVFRRLREFGLALGLPELSMGMSGDFEVAIAEGATIVRIGRAIFGARR
jgi:pyridoxal phosphate enzyme (YggS family)